MLELANKDSRVFVTCDTDFKAKNIHPSKATSGIIVVKLKKPADFKKVLSKFCNKFTEQDISSMQNKIIEVGKVGYYTVSVDQWGSVQKRYVKFVITR